MANGFINSLEACHAILENAVEGILIADIDSRQFMYANRAVSEMFGYSSEEFTRLSLHDIHPDVQLPEVSRIFMQQARGETGLATSILCKRKNGSIFRADINTSKIVINGSACNVGFFTDVTERTRTEDALRESLERFSKAFSTTPFPYIISNIEEGRIIDVNDAFYEYTGFSREEVLGKTTFDLKIWANVEERQDVIAMLQKGDKVINREIRFRVKNGDIKVGKIFSHTMKLGEKTCVVTIVEDVTARKAAQEALQKSEERYRCLIETTGTGYVMIDLEGRVIDANAEYVRLSGHQKLEEILGRSVLDWTAENEKSDHLKAVGTCLEKGYIKNFEISHVDKNSNIIPVEINAAIIETEGKRYILSLCRDISDRRQAEKKLRESEENFRTLFDESPLPTLLSELPSGKIAFVNKRLADAFGCKPEDVIGETGDSLGFLQNSSDQKKLTDLITRNGFVDNVEVEKRFRDGTPGHSLISMRIVTLSGKMYCLTTIQDITENKKTEALLMNAQKLDALGVLAGGIAHDFNNLLTGIFGYTDLARSITNDTKIAQYLDVMLSTLNRAKALTLQLLTFAKGGTPIQKTMPIVPFLQETIRFALSGSNINSTFDIADNLWACNIDKNQIGQVIDNIVINAQQAMPDGGAIEVTVKNSTFKESEHLPLAAGNYVKISIKDSGIGMSKEIMRRIFDPFFTTKTKGHGLGLATCYSIISRHCGCIDVDSEPGKGSTFHVYLPASKESVVNETAILASHKGSGTFIVVDDEEVVRDTIRGMLESMGYTVICKSEGKEAIDFFINETRTGRKVAAMIFDLTIPGGMGGKDAVTEIRKIDTMVPVFVVSGYADNGALKYPVEHGFTASIFKPFTMAELSEMLNKNLRSFR